MTLPLLSLDKTATAVAASTHRSTWLRNMLRSRSAQEKQLVATTHRKTRSRCDILSRDNLPRDDLPHGETTLHGAPIDLSQFVSATRPASCDA
jgi:hypothetical protein